MSAPISDTPRTDAAWAKTFEDDEDQCRAGNAATDMREECAQLELELTAEREKAERYRLATLKLNAELTAERERVRVLRSALENLQDEQNGAPLCTREEEWKQAMAKADLALATTEDAK